MACCVKIQLVVQFPKKGFCMKICIDCKKEKEIIEFVKQNEKYRNTCKECKNNKRRKNTINRHRFEKGMIPWNKGKHDSQHRSQRIYEWGQQIKDRDGNECKKCGSKYYLHAHHIIPWKENKELRFDISNGITVCRKCHLKIEPRRKKGYIPSEESRRKSSISSKGQRRSIKSEFKKGEKALNPFPKGHIPWNKGLKKVKV